MGETTSRDDLAKVPAEKLQALVREMREIMDRIGGSALDDIAAQIQSPHMETLTSVDELIRRSQIDPALTPLAPEFFGSTWPASRIMPGSSKWPDDLHRIVSVRIYRAAQAMVEEADPSVLMESLASATDKGALARIVSGTQFSDAETELDPLAGPVAKTIEHRRILKEKAGEMLSSGQVEELLGVSRQAIDKRRKSGRLLALRLGSDWAYPALQFIDGGVDQLMQDVLGAHAKDDPWVVLDVLLANDEALGGRNLLEVIQSKDGPAIDRYLAQLDGDGFA